MDNPTNKLDTLMLAVVVTAGTFGALARMAAGNRVPNKSEALLAVTASAGSAIFVAPTVATYLAMKLGVECNLQFIGAVGWLFSVLSMNIVILLTNLDLSKWLAKGQAMVNKDDDNES